MFWIASMTKAIVSVAALQLIEQGTLELEQPVADILPAFGALQVLEGFDGDTPRLREPARQATIRQLLTHTSGAGYWFQNADVLRYLQLTGIPDPFAGKLASLYDVPLVADPGTRWEYGTSADWLGLVVREVSGQDLAAYCAEHIFGPLDMPDTTFAPSEEQFARAMTLAGDDPVRANTERRSLAHPDRPARGPRVPLRWRWRVVNRPRLPALHARPAARRRARRGARAAGGDGRAGVHRPPPRCAAARRRALGGARGEQ